MCIKFLTWWRPPSIIKYIKHVFEKHIVFLLCFATFLFCEERYFKCSCFIYWRIITIIVQSNEKYMYMVFFGGMLGYLLLVWSVNSFYRSDQDVHAGTIWTYLGRTKDVLWSSWTILKQRGLIMDGSWRNRNEIELVTKRTWTGWSRTVWKRCT